MGIEATPVIQPSTTEAECSELDLIPEETDFQDGCPVLPKIRAHVVARSQCGTLCKTMRTRQGEPVDLTPCACPPASETSESLDPTEEPFCGVRVRITQAVMVRSCDPIFEIEGDVTDQANGQVKAAIPAELANTPGIYQEEWGVFDATGRLQFTNTGLLFIEPGLFGVPKGHSSIADRLEGPPSLQEIRLSIRDYPTHNLLLDDVEFRGVEILQAITRPIRNFNEFPPPISRKYSTNDFPWKEHWLRGIHGYLYQMAEAWYRRNRLNTNAGGVSVDDLNKFNEYARESKRALTEWERFMLLKKTELNMRDTVTTVGSTYGGMGGR
jgi:hypothetical protein